MKFICFVFCILGLHIHVEGAEFRFGEKNDDTCILLNMDATFNLTFTDDNNNTEMAPLFDLEGATVYLNKSLCGTEKYAAVLTVNIFPSNERLAFKFVRRNNQVEMSVVLDVIPGKHFVDHNTTIGFEMEDGGNLQIGALSTTSFMCKSAQNMIFDRDEPYNMTMKITNLQVQAYNVEGNTFGPAVECPEDSETTQVPTTEPIPESTMVVTTPSSTDVPVYVLRQNDKACIVLRGNLKFVIKYKKNNDEIGEVPVLVPENVAVSGNCRPDNTTDVETITLTFFETKWVLDIDIGIVQSSLFGVNEEMEYGWQNIRLSFDVDDHFDDAENQGKRITVETEKMDNFKASSAGSYKCNAEQSIDLNNDVTFKVSNMQYYAFSQTNDDTFPDTGVSECDADMDNDDDDNDRTVAIVLGSVFGGLAVIVFIIGFVWKVKSRRRVEYEQLSGIAGVSYDRSIARSDTSMEKRMY